MRTREWNVAVGIRNVPHRLRYFNTYFLLLFEDVMDPLDDAALLKKETTSSSVVSVCFSSVCFVFVIKVVISQLCTPVACCYVSPTIMISTFETVGQNKPCEKLIFVMVFYHCSKSS